MEKELDRPKEIVNLEKQVQALVAETEDFDDAMNYIETVATDCGVNKETAIKELRSQYNEV